MLTLSKTQARRFLIRYHGLDKLNTHGKNNRGILRYLQKIGSIQYDPLNIVGRNPEIVLFSRFSHVDRTTLDQLLYKDRLLVDGYDKEVCIYPMSQYPYFKRVRQHFAHYNELAIEYRHQEEVYDYIDDVFEKFKEKAPCSGKDLSFSALNKNDWGNSRIASVALDYLYAHERLGIHSRNGAMKVYDCIEKLIPSSYLLNEDPFEDDLSFIEWYTLRRINSIGFYWDRSGPGWQGLHLSNSTTRKAAIHSLCEKGKLTEFRISDSKYHYYIATEHLKQLETPIRLSPFVRFIAPLDNLIWDRQLIQELFDFEYRWEVYKPVKARQFGYYVLPILYKDHLVGRFDPDRTTSHFAIDQIWWENGFIPDSVFNKLFEKEKERFSQFLD